MDWKQMTKALLLLILAAPVQAQTLVGVVSGMVTTSTTSVGESDITSNLLSNTNFPTITDWLVRTRSRLKANVQAGLDNAINNKELELFSAYRRYLTWNDPWSYRECKRLVEAPRQPNASPPPPESLLATGLYLWGPAGSGGAPSETFTGYCHARHDLATKVEQALDRAHEPTASDRDGLIPAAMILSLVRLDCASWNVRSVRVTEGPILVNVAATGSPRKFVVAKVVVGHDRTRGVGIPDGRQTVTLRVTSCADFGPIQDLDNAPAAGFWMEEMAADAHVDRTWRAPRR